MATLLQESLRFGSGGPRAKIVPELGVQSVMRIYAREWEREAIQVRMSPGIDGFDRIAIVGQIIRWQDRDYRWHEERRDHWMAPVEFVKI